MNLKKRFGKRIQELRLRNNLKQIELAEKVGIATKHQSCIETGKNYPSAELVENYAKVFNVDVSEILSIKHINDRKLLVDDINALIERADDSQIITIHKILNGILN